MRPLFYIHQASCISPQETFQQVNLDTLHNPVGKKMLSVEQLSSFETGVNYLMYQAFFLFFIGTTQLVLEKQKGIIFYFTLIGSILFSGSIFLLTTKKVSDIDFKFLGPVTPIGGLFLILSWGITFYYIVVKKV